MEKYQAKSCTSTAVYEMVKLSNGTKGKKTGDEMANIFGLNKKHPVDAIIFSAQ